MIDIKENDKVIIKTTPGLFAKYMFEEEIVAKAYAGIAYTACFEIDLNSGKVYGNKDSKLKYELYKVIKGEST